jgi:hypothetical protein
LTFPLEVAAAAVTVVAMMALIEVALVPAVVTN